MIESRNIDIFITAGGKSSRMGQDKGLMPLMGKPMICHLTDTLDQNNLSYSVIAHDPKYEELGFRVYKDILPEKGPMGALLTAFYFSRKDYVLLLGCDTPFLPGEVVRRLMFSAKPGRISISCFRKNIQPLMAVYPVSLLDDLLTYVTNDLLKMRSWVTKSKLQFIEMDDLEKSDPLMFTNFNHKKDIEK